MVSNLSSIGLNYPTDDAFTSAMEQLAQGPAAEANGAPYAIWASSSGARLYFHLGNGGREVVGLTPFFEGSSQTVVKPVEPIKRPGETAYEGALVAWIVSPDDGSDLYPVVFDIPNFADVAGHVLPEKAMARITAFAHQVRAFPSAEAYTAAQPDEPKFAPQSFVPIGMFAAAAEGDNANPPSSNALFSGTVLGVSSKSNEATGQSFVSMTVATLSATFDVVADPAAIEGDIIPGGTIEVTCGLFGRLL